MDAWGYSFRLGSTHAWFESDATDARAWLVAHGLIDVRDDLAGVRACAPARRHPRRGLMSWRKRARRVAQLILPGAVLPLFLSACSQVLFFAANAPTFGQPRQTNLRFMEGPARICSTSIRQ